MGEKWENINEIRFDIARCLLNLYQWVHRGLLLFHYCYISKLGVFHSKKRKQGLISFNFVWKLRNAMAILEIIGGITGMLQNRVRNNVEASETHFASKNFKKLVVKR